MRPSLLKNRIMILAAGCVLTLGFANVSYADGCWGSSRGGWGSGGGSYGSRGGLFSNAPVRNLLRAIGSGVGNGLANIGNGLANVSQRRPLVGGSNGSSWGGSRGGLSSRGSNWGSQGSGWGSGGGWGSSGSSYASSGGLLTSPVSSPSYLSSAEPSYAEPSYVSSAEPSYVSTDSLLDLPILTHGGYGSAGSIGAYGIPTDSYAGTISPATYSDTSLSMSSLNQFETSTHVLDYGYYGSQFGDLGLSTDSVLVDGGLMTGPMLEFQDGSNNVIETPPSELDFPNQYDGDSELTPDDVFGAEEDDSAYLPRGKAILSLNVPREAKVYINDKLTRTSGSNRKYVSRNLAFGEKYRYRVRVVSQVDGKEVTKTREITMRGGTNREFAFNFDPVVTRVVVNVPKDAKVVIDGTETATKGSFRSFSTEKLKTGKWKDYSVEVSVVRDGKTITKRESFDLGAGEFRFFEFEFGQASKSNVATK